MLVLGIGYFTIRITEHNNCGTIEFFSLQKTPARIEDEGRGRVQTSEFGFILSAGLLAVHILWTCSSGRAGAQPYRVTRAGAQPDPPRAQERFPRAFGEDTDTPYTDTPLPQPQSLPARPIPKYRKPSFFMVSGSNRLRPSKTIGVCMAFRTGSKSIA